MTSPDFLPLALDALIKTTLVLSVAGVAALLLRRRAASWRHLAWTTALVGTLLMPAVAGFAPEWTAPIDLPLPLRAAAVAPDPGLAPTVLSPVAAPAAKPLLSEAITVEKLPPLSAGSLQQASPAGAPLSLGALLLATWAAGSLFVLAWTLRAHLRAAALVRRARPLKDRELELLLADSAAGPRVRLLESNEIDVPLATGLIRPVLLVPAGFDEWSSERRRIVLLHELAHVERGDCLALTLARAAVSIWWFHPLAWFALARLRHEAEQAADDRVLESGTRPSDYATHLLAVVRSLKGYDPSPVGLSMAGSNVERRLLAMLDPSRSRRRLSPAALVLCTVAVTGGVVALGGLRADASPSKIDHSANSQVEPSQPLADEGWTVGLADNSQEGEGFFGVAKRLIGHDEGSRAFSEAMKQHRAGNYEASAEGFRRAYEEGHAEGTSSFNVACALARLGRDREAIDWLERAFDEGFSHYDALETDEDLAFIRDSRRFESFRDSMQARAEEHRQLRYEKKRRYFEPELEDMRDPDFTEGAKAYSLGYELHGIEDWAGAEEAWRRAAELDHSPANSHYNVACALARQGKDSEALDWLEKAIVLGFDDLSNLERDDDLASLRGRTRFAELRDTAAALRTPGDINDLDEIRENRAEWVEFTKRSGKLARRHPQMGKAWLQHGIGLLRTERFDEAAAAFRKAGETGQHAGLCRWNEACALAGAGRRDEAVAALRSSLESGFGSGWQLAQDPDLQSLEGHSGFEALKNEYPAKADGHGIHGWVKQQLHGGERHVY